MKKILTIAILTKNRRAELEKCLLAFAPQVTSQIELLVINNNPAEDLLFFKEICDFKYVKSSLSSVPALRNLAIKKCKTKHLAFIDDDCLPAKDWVKIATNQIKRFPKTAIFQGMSGIENKDSLVAVAEFARLKYWQDRAQDKKGISAHVFDTKNMILNLETLKKHQIKFDPEMSDDWFDSADADLGFQINKKNITSRLVKNLFVSHKETPHLGWYLKKAKSRGKIAYKLAQKWQLRDEIIDYALEKFLKTSIKQLIRERSYWWSYWKRAYNDYSSYINFGFGRRILVFLIIKLYDWQFLVGYRLGEKK